MGERLACVVTQLSPMLTGVSERKLNKARRQPAEVHVWIMPRIQNIASWMTASKAGERLSWRAVQQPNTIRIPTASVRRDSNNKGEMLPLADMAALVTAIPLGQNCFARAKPRPRQSTISQSPWSSMVAARARCENDLGRPHDWHAGCQWIIRMFASQIRRPL